MPTLATPSSLLSAEEARARASELDEILATMDVPTGRRADWLWLGRNLAMKNAAHLALARELACHDRASVVAEVLLRR